MDEQLQRYIYIATVEPYNLDTFGNLGKFPVYTGTPLLWTPWEPGEVSYIHWNLSIVDTLGTWGSVLYTEGCPHFRNPSIVDTLQLGTWYSVLYREVFSFQG